MIIICVCGASGSGKTSLAVNINKKLAKNEIKSVVLTLDSYYITYPEMSFCERTNQNYDSPDAFDFELLKEDILKLKNGKSITAKKYNYKNHLRCDTDEMIAPPQVLIIEGIHSFYDKELFNNSNLRIFVDTELDICAVRRMCRDARSRGRNADAVAKQYFETVRPMYEKYIRMYKYDADICVAGGGFNKRAVDVLCTCIKSLLYENKQC